jgi:hypothetical protein
MGELPFAGSAANLEIFTPGRTMQMENLFPILILASALAFPAPGFSATAASPATVPKATAPATATPSAAKSSADTAKETLDQGRIHDLYNNGDFDPVVTVIESFVQRNKTYSLADSIFIAKHLAVVYSANPATREKGKYYMFRLLELLPSAKLVDMYVSDEVDRIFDKVREEFMVRQHGFGVDTSRISLPGRADPKHPEAGEKQSHVLLWSCVAAGGVALATGGYFLFQNTDGEPDAKPEPVDVKVITPKN